MRVPSRLSTLTATGESEKIQAVSEIVIAVALGAASWPFVEYLIHGWLSHVFQTFVTPLHWEHHREPRRVFTSPLAWVPIMVLMALGLSRWLGAPLALAGTGGLLLGFLRYEYVHWRIHFRAPRSRSQAVLREHHLAHHFVRPSAYFGVTTRLFDRAFGSLPADHVEDYARVRSRPPLTGPSNLGQLIPRSS